MAPVEPETGKVYQNEYQFAALTPDATEVMVAAFRALLDEYQIKGFNKPETYKAAKLALLDYDENEKTEAWPQ